MDKALNVKQRVPLWDFIKGVAIIQVVSLHTFMPPLGSSYLVSSFLSCFVIVSGIFFRPEKNKMVKNACRLLIPYLFTTIIYLPYSYILTGSFIRPRSIWFLLMLFEVMILSNYICKFKSTIVQMIIATALSYFGYYLGRNNIHLPFSLGGALSVIIFFFIGKFLGNIYDKIILAKAYVFIPFAFLYAIYIYI